MHQEIPSFDILLNLAQQHPDQLEQLQKKLINHAIDAASPPQHQRLRGLQFQIESTRLLAKTPLAACIKISAMMRQSFYELSELLNQPHETDLTTVQKNHNTKVLPFRQQ